ncbi:hypothetical protein DFH06DRAFT_1338790 [Mycena polygramma]|nr:hypothetical protein DFH06DRAFT_1338790 [Mycena polygramma]
MFMNFLLVAAFASAPLLSTAAPAAADVTIMANSTCPDLSTRGVSALLAAGTVTNLVSSVATTAGSAVGGVGSTLGGVVGGVVGTVGGALGTATGLTTQGLTLLNTTVTQAATQLAAVGTAAQQAGGLVSNLVNGAASSADAAVLAPTVQSFITNVGALITLVNKLAGFVQTSGGASSTARKAVLQQPLQTVSTDLSVVQVESGFRSRFKKTGHSRFGKPHLSCGG